MANRPVFAAKDSSPFFRIYNVEFTWNAGQSKSQKQKNVNAIHAAFAKRYPEKKVLEISSKSMQEGGEALSAFNLKKYVPSLGKSVPVESIYHAGKVFQHGGPYLDLLTATPKRAKHDERLHTSGNLIGFEFEGKCFPLKPSSAFYDYLYINALLENEDLIPIVLSYDGFTDIEFNPNKSIGCQARSAAIFSSLYRRGSEQIREIESFLKMYSL